eukprot:1789378-Rhodomonas_salina.2
MCYQFWERSDKQIRPSRSRRGGQAAGTPGRLPPAPLHPRPSPGKAKQKNGKKTEEKLTSVPQRAVGMRDWEREEGVVAARGGGGAGRGARCLDGEWPRRRSSPRDPGPSRH